MKLLIKILIGSIILLATAGLAVGLYFIFKKSDPVKSNTGSNNNPIPNPPNEINNPEVPSGVQPKVPSGVQPKVPSGVQPKVSSGVPPQGQPQDKPKVPQFLVQQPPTPKEKCNIIILDAKTYKTEIFIYEWECREKFYIPEIKQVGNDFEDSGLTPGNGENVTKQYMKSLIEQIEILFTNTAKGIKAETPIMLAITGDVQTFSEEQKALFFSIISDKLQNSGFFFLSNQIRLISEKEVRIFLWMAVNYLQTKFQTNPPSPLKTIALDLGGASTQIAFETPRISGFEIDFENVGIEKNTKQLSVFSKQFEDFGLENARNEVKRLFDQDEDTSKYLSGCFNSGVEKITNTKFQISDVIGQSNPDACISKINEYLQLSGECTSNDQLYCSINGQQITKIPAQNSAIVVSGIQKVMEFFKFQDKFKPSELLEASKTFCSLTYAELFAWKGELENEDLQRMCFMGLYSAQLLMNVYNIASDQTIYAIQQIDEKDPGWAFGLAVDFVLDKQCDSIKKAECKNNKEMYLNTNTNPTGSNPPGTLRRLRLRTTHEQLT